MASADGGEHKCGKGYNREGTEPNLGVGITPREVDI